MLISRCAWHPRNYGYAKLLGVSHWRGLGIAYTDGICRKCAARVHADVRRLPTGGGRPAAHDPAPTSEIFVVAVAVVTGLMLVARPANEGSVPVEPEYLLPRALTVALDVTDPQPVPAPLPVRAVRRPRVAHVTPVVVTPGAVTVHVLPASARQQSP